MYPKLINQTNAISIHVNKEIISPGTYLQKICITELYNLYLKTIYDYRSLYIWSSMGIIERKEREKNQRRSDIIDAAEKLFFSEGLNNTTMDEIANEAEYSKGTLYLYFKSKEDLYLAITIRGMKILESMFSKVLKKSENGLCKTRNMGETYFKFAHKYPNYFNAMVYYESNEIKIEENSTNAKNCEEQGDKTLQPVAAAVQEGIGDGSIRPDLDPLQVATILWAHCTGVITIISLRGEHIEKHHGVKVKDLIDLSFEMIGRSIQK